MGINKYSNINFHLIETMLVQNGQVLFEQEHLQRMEKSAKELGFGFELQNVKCKMQNLIKKTRGQEGKRASILRVLLSQDGIIDIKFLSFEEIKTNKVSVSKIAVDSSEKLLYHKTDHRPWYDEALAKIKQGEIFDEIFFNEKGELTEGARSNIILQIDGEFFTPSVSCGLLDGIMRQKLLKQGFNPPPDFSDTRPSHRKTTSPARGAEFLPCQMIEEKTLYFEDLKRAQKVFCINSVRGIVEVELPPALEGEACFQLEHKSAKVRKQGGGDNDSN